MSKKLPGFFHTHAAQNAKRRYLRDREPETKKIEKKRETAGDVVGICVMCALNKYFDLGEMRLQRVADSAAATAEQFERRNITQGWISAKKKLDEDIADVFTGEFILPVVVTPRNNREWLHLSEQRDAADAVVKFYIKALREVMGFGKDRTAAFVQAVEREYRAFAEYAKDGVYYGYYKPAQQVSEILREEMTVDESNAEMPMFGRTLD